MIQAIWWRNVPICGGNIVFMSESEPFGTVDNEYKATSINMKGLTMKVKLKGSRQYTKRGVFSYKK